MILRCGKECKKAPLWCGGSVGAPALSRAPAPDPSTPDPDSESSQEFVEADDESIETILEIIKEEESKAESATPIPISMQKEAGANITIISKRLPQEELMLLYQESEVHVLASWFETTGLSSLEAAYMGCKLVVTKCGDTIDYFKDYVEYCKHDSIELIYEAVILASKNTFSNILKTKIEEEYNWNYAAKCTFEAYEMMDND